MYIPAAPTDRPRSQRGSVHWPAALCFGAITGGALWGVLAGLLLGTPLVDELRPNTKWLIVAAVSSAPLALGGLTAALAASVRVRSVGVGSIVCGVSGWMMLAWVGVQSSLGG
ncbi:hypothetical protein [Mycobacterium sp. OAE908]|uniref:hypothetical protein n=1 Tax=Mycobacterium sp. OAE908 TaxID=2817899 RepID=UPI001AE6A79F